MAACKSERACFSSRDVSSSAIVASNCPFSTLFPIAPRPAEKDSAKRMKPSFCARTRTTKAGSIRTVPYTAEMAVPRRTLATSATGIRK
ncbi:MAG: hypothetical protein DMF20_04665 [Verrucomicrobia bacterium]|nr:MAG: hypothetical protein DMF20_04665 [Verrucomicrobiota bacterium]